MLGSIRYTTEGELLAYLRTLNYSQRQRLKRRLRALFKRAELKSVGATKIGRQTKTPTRRKT